VGGSSRAAPNPSPCARWPVPVRRLQGRSAPDARAVRGV